MTGKQKIAVAIGVVFLSIAFVFLYRQFSMESGTTSVVPPPTPPSMPASPLLSSETEREVDEMMKPTPSAPDSIVDDILQNDSELSAIGDEEVGEIQAAEESVQIIDDLSNAYEEE